MRNKLGQFVKGHGKGKELPIRTRLKISESKKKIPSPWLHTPEANKRRGDALRGKNNSQWKGDKAGYNALHKWVIHRLGQPDTCSKCKRSGLSGPQIHWANKDGKYLRELDCWIRLCVKCHKRHDSLIGFGKVKQKFISW